MLDIRQPRTQAVLLACGYAVIALGVLFGESPDDRIGGLVFFLVLLAGLLAAAVVRLRPFPMAILLWSLAGAQTLVLIAMLAAHVGNAGVVASLNVVLIAGMVSVAGAFGRTAGPRNTR